MKRDALGDDIVIGAIYGYSNRANGIVHVTIGKALKFTKKAVTLEVIHKGSSVYQQPIQSLKGEHKLISVSSNSIFRLESSDVNWNVRTEPINHLEEYNRKHM